MPSPSYVPVLRTGVDVSFKNLTVTGTADITGATHLLAGLTVDGFTALAAAQTSGNLTIFGSALVLGVAGTGLQIKEGANACSGAATLVAGTVTVPTTKVTANSRVQLTIQSLGTVTAPKAIGVTARAAGASFTITSADATDTSLVGWTIVEPAA